MRLEGQKKAGFYPTPLNVVERIARFLRPSVDHLPYSFLDPTAGEGAALSRLAKLFPAPVRTFGIELDGSRAGVAKKHLARVYRGDARNFAARDFSLLFLNPPYDWGNGERLELEFLRLFTPALQPGGVLVYIIPEHYLKNVSPFLTAHYQDLTAWRFPKEEYRTFRQIVVLGYRRHEAGEPNDPPPLQGELPPFAPHHYYLPEDRGARIRRRILDPKRLLTEAKNSPLWKEFWSTLPSPSSLRFFEPLVPLSEGHLALLLAAGYLNSTILNTEDGRLLLKGRVEKHVETIVGEDKTIEREYYRTTLTAWNLDTGELTHLQ